MVDTLPRHRVWASTQFQIYTAIFDALHESLSGGGIIPCPLENEQLFILTGPQHIRRGISGKDIAVHTNNGWIYVPVPVLDRWATSFDLIGPTEHHVIVKEAIADGYDVPKHVREDWLSCMGGSQRARQDAKRVQLTRARNIWNQELPSVFDVPAPQEIAAHKGDQCVIATVLAYRSLDRTWIIVPRDDLSKRLIVNRLNVGPTSRLWEIAEGVLPPANIKKVKE